MLITNAIRRGAAVFTAERGALHAGGFLQILLSFEIKVILRICENARGKIYLTKTMWFLSQKGN